MREWADILQKEFPHLATNRDLFLGHLFKECEAMSADCSFRAGEARNDYGWAIGIAQWHIPDRYAGWMKANGFYYTHNPDYVVKMREKFYADHPEMSDHFYQVRKYFSDITTAIHECERKRDKNPVYCAVRSWNRGAGHAYFVAVEKKAKYMVPLLLNL